MVQYDRKLMLDEGQMLSAHKTMWMIDNMGMDSKCLAEFPAYGLKLPVSLLLRSKWESDALAYYMAKCTASLVLFVFQ